MFRSATKIKKTNGFYTLFATYQKLSDLYINEFTG